MDSQDVDTTTGQAPQQSSKALPEKTQPLPSSATGESSEGYLHIPAPKKIVAQVQDFSQGRDTNPKDNSTGRKLSSSTPEVEASQSVKSRAQNSSGSSAPTDPDLLQKAVGVYKQTKTRDPSIPPEPKDMTPEILQPTSILRRNHTNPPNANNDNIHLETSANKSPSTPRIQFTILKRPGESPTGQVHEAANVNREENGPPRVPIPEAVAIPTTSSGVANGPPVEQSRVEPKRGLADPTDRDFFWDPYGVGLYPFPLHISEPIKKQLLRTVDLSKNKRDENRVQEVRNYIKDLAEDTDRSKFLWNHRKSFDKDLGQLMDVKAHHTVEGDEEMIQAPPQFIDDADFFASLGKAPAAVDPDEIQLESLSLYEYKDWRTRDDWRTWRMLPAAPGEIGARIEKRYRDCTREQMVWIEMMYCSVKNLGDVRLRSSEVRNMFRERFGCEIPEDWKGLAVEIARDASRKMLKYRLKSPGMLIGRCSSITLE
jgi:hypothetical protein